MQTEGSRIQDKSIKPRSPCLSAIARRATAGSVATKSGAVEWVRTLLFSLILCFNYLQAKEIFILVPGTWSKDQGWHQENGFFFDTLKFSTLELDTDTISFTWSGRLNHEARVVASQKLVSFIQKLNHSVVNLVTHSHGTNVAILASQLLAQQKSTVCINSFYALGTPVDTHRYMPNMSIITHFYHLFSCGDCVQQVFGAYRRKFPHHERIVNISVFLNGTPPNHSQLHDPVIARWLPLLHKSLAQKKVGNFEKFTFNQPGVIYFSYDHAPIYKEDIMQELLLTRNKRGMNKKKLNFFVKKRYPSIQAIGT